MVRTPKVEELEDGRIKTTYYIGNDPHTIVEYPQYRVAEVLNEFYAEHYVQGSGYIRIDSITFLSYEDTLDFIKELSSIEFVQDEVKPEIKYHSVKL